MLFALHQRSTQILLALLSSRCSWPRKRKTSDIDLWFIFQMHLASEFILFHSVVVGKGEKAQEQEQEQDERESEHRGESSK
jgi:hypothetical protein